MTITAEQVKELRERTGAGLMECKKALAEANGDMEGAIELMRKRGIAKAAKKADRTATEGAVAIQLSPDQKSAFMVEVNCETDFVGKDQNFIAFVQTVATQGLGAGAQTVEQLLSLSSQVGNQTIEQMRQELVAKLGENIRVRRVVFMQSPDGIVSAYRHGERIGVLVQLNVNNPQLGKDIAMHIAASNPQALAPEDVAQDMINKEREIFSAQALASGKPQAIVEKMIDGRIKKFLGEVSLLGQPFVKNPSETVLDLLTAANAKVINFQRFEVGEGIEKETTNFADEVMAQVRGNR